MLLLIIFDEPDLTLRASACGAQGFLLKEASPEDLPEAVLALAAGKTLLAPVATDPVRSRYACRETGAPTGLVGRLPFLTRLPQSRPAYSPAP